MSLLVTARPVVAASGLRQPGAVVVDSRGHAWVAESDRHGVVEIDPATGRILRTISAPAFGFDDPIALTVVGDHVWAASVGFTGDRGNDSAARLTEFSARSGALVRTVDLKRRGIQGLSGLYASGLTLWVSASRGSAVVALDTRTGRVRRKIVTGPVVGGAGPSGIVVSAGRVIYPDQGYGVITIRDAATGRLLRRLIPRVLMRVPGIDHKVPGQLGPLFVQPTSTDLWAVCGSSRHVASASVVEISRRTGRITRVIDARSNDLYNPKQIAFDGRHLFVLSGALSFRGRPRGASLTEIDVATGTTVRVVRFAPRDGMFAEPTGLALDHSRILVTDQGAARLLVLDAASLRIERVVG